MRAIVIAMAAKVLGFGLESWVFGLGSFGLATTQGFRHRKKTKVQRPKTSLRLE
jgi:hypothetical protein